jgi:hypothetical protein
LIILVSFLPVFFGILKLGSELNAKERPVTLSPIRGIIA